MNAYGFPKLEGSVASGIHFFANIFFLHVFLDNVFNIYYSELDKDQNFNR